MPCWINKPLPEANQSRTCWGLRISARRANWPAGSSAEWAPELRQAKRIRKQFTFARAEGRAPAGVKANRRRKSGPEKIFEVKSSVRVSRGCGLGSGQLPEQHHDRGQQKEKVNARDLHAPAHDPQHEQNGNDRPEHEAPPGASLKTRGWFTG